MKVLVLGAAGKAGRSAVSSLLAAGGIERIILADNNAEGLTKLAADLSHMPVSTRFLDAEDERSLSDRMLEADLVLGCLGPFHLHEGRIVEAAISTRRDYISLCDDPGAAAAAFAQHADAARKGVRVLCGCGLTPGLSNLLACRAGSHLDKVDSLELTWHLAMGSNLGAATLDHLLRVFYGQALARKGGREIKTRAGGWEELVEFPPPVGWREVCFVAHPEPITLPQAIDGVAEVWFKGGVGGRGRGLALQSLAWMGSEEESELRARALQAALRIIARTGTGSSLSAFRVTARGVRDGDEKRVELAVVGDYYGLSGTMLAAAVERWMEGRWPAGIYPPERVLDDRVFFDSLSRRGTRFLVGEARQDSHATDHHPPEI